MIKESSWWHKWSWFGWVNLLISSQALSSCPIINLNHSIHSSLLWWHTVILILSILISVSLLKKSNVSNITQYSLKKVFFTLPFTIFLCFSAKWPESHCHIITNWQYRPIWGLHTLSFNIIPLALCYRPDVYKELMLCPNWGQLRVTLLENCNHSFWAIIFCRTITVPSKVLSQVKRNILASSCSTKTCS